MSELSPARGRLRDALAFIRSAEARSPVSSRAIRNDVILASLMLVFALLLARFNTLGILTAMVTCAPLAGRRLFPLPAFFVILGCALVAKGFVTYASFISLDIAAYSAVVHSRYRGVALTSMAPAGVVIARVFWNSPSLLRSRPPLVQSVRLGPRFFIPGLEKLETIPDAPWRLTSLFVLVSLTSIAIVGVAIYANDRIRAMKAEHEAATRRAIELERTRIASELHDVVTHNVSVMIVQAGAARQVLGQDQGKATAALLAVESSGRAAMSELRHLLGLLSPPDRDQPAPDADPTTAELRPQPGVGQLKALTDRVAATGLPVELHLGSLPDGLPPGVDLAAFRVVQEALTNVIKHAGKPRTDIWLDYEEGDLVIEVLNAGRPIPAAGPICPGAGRGLLGLRERIAIYGGELRTGPAPGGGWLVRARVPANPLAAPAPAAADPLGAGVP